MDYPIAKQSFEHGMISARRGKPIKQPLSRQTLAELASRGLIDLPVADAGGHPGQADGAKSSASPAAPASPQTTANESANGETPDEPNAEPTPEDQPAPEPETTSEPTSEDQQALAFESGEDSTPEAKPSRGLFKRNRRGRSS